MAQDRPAALVTGPAGGTGRYPWRHVELAWTA